MAEGRIKYCYNFGMAPRPFPIKDPDSVKTGRGFLISRDTFHIGGIAVNSPGSRLHETAGRSGSGYGFLNHDNHHRRRHGLVRNEQTRSHREKACSGQGE